MISRNGRLVEHNKLVLVGRYSHDLLEVPKALGVIFNLARGCCMFEAIDGAPISLSKELSADRERGYKLYLALKVLPPLTRDDALGLFGRMLNALNSGGKSFQLRHNSYYVKAEGDCAASDILFPQP